MYSVDSFAVPSPFAFENTQRKLERSLDDGAFGVGQDFPFIVGMEEWIALLAVFGEHSECVWERAELVRRRRVVGEMTDDAIVLFSWTVHHAFFVRANIISEEILMTMESFKPLMNCSTVNQRGSPWNPFATLNQVVEGGRVTAFDFFEAGIVDDKESFAGKFGE